MSVEHALLVKLGHGHSVCCCLSAYLFCLSATDDFNHGVVLSSRALRDGEVFQVRIDKMVDKWAGSIEIGVTTHNPAYLQLPSTMTNLRSGELSGRGGPGGSCP